MIAANDNSAPAKAGALRFLSFCSGIEAASVAWPQWQAVAFAEIEKFPSAVLAHHYPEVPNLGDFTAINTRTLGRVDILCGGTPCQAFSVAGARGGLNDARGNLTLSFVELAHALANGNGLRNVVWENVPGVLSDKTNAFGCFLAGLVGADAPLICDKRWPNAGMVAGPKGRAAWRVLDAQFFGLAQRRKRVIVVADFGNGADPAAVLFEPEGVRRDSPPSRETGEGIAPTISARTKGGGGLGTDFDLDGGLIHAIQERAVSENLENGPQGKGYQPDIAYTLEARNKVQAVAYAPPIARCVATREGSSQDYESTTMVAVGVIGPISHALKAEGADVSEDGTGCGTPIIAFQSNQSFDSGNNIDVAPTLRIGSGGQGQPPAVVCFSAKDYGADASVDIAPTLRAGCHTSSHANAGVMPAIAFMQNQLGEVRTSDVVGTLNTNANASGRSTAMALVTSAVRRLTPRECERLMGFPDDYTAIPWRGKSADQCPDGPRYKVLGNSWAVPLFTWLGKRIASHMPPIAANDNHKDATSAAA